MKYQYPKNPVPVQTVQSVYEQREESILKKIDELGYEVIDFRPATDKDSYWYGYDDSIWEQIDTDEPRLILKKKKVIRHLHSVLNVENLGKVFNVEHWIDGKRVSSTTVQISHLDGGFIALNKNSGGRYYSTYQDAKSYDIRIIE